MKDGDRKKIRRAIKEAVAPAIEEMCGKTHKRDEMFEDAWSDYDMEPAEPNNPEYMRGWEDGHEAGKIGAAMYGEGKTNFPGNEVAEGSGHPYDGVPGEWSDIMQEIKSNLKKKLKEIK